ncbi:MAG: DUF3098 domain-containing protein [Bacteroidales bacterium]|nr:DUF3098 domain-containing protein [Candidatus Hennigimonas equi]
MNGKFALTPKGVRLMIIGLVVMIAGYILMCGPAVKDPAIFNYDMFDFRRLVAAPVVIVCGIIIEIVAIMRTGRKEGK